MNVRPTRAPAPPEDANFEEVDRMADATREMIQQRTPEARINHSPPAVRAQQSNSMPSEGPVQQPDLPQTGFAKLAAAIANVMAEIKPVEKSGWNDFHKYNYAKMGDLSIELTPLMGRNGIVVFQNEVDRAMFDEGKVISVRYQFTVVHSSGEIWPERPLITGMSRCRDSKGGFDDKAFNKAHTAARKYFLLSLFQIPTDDEHPDADNDGGNGKRPAGRRAPAPDGKVQPHLIPIEQGETPAGWAVRFKAVTAKASGKEEIDLWYDANHNQFGKVKTADETVYNDLLDYMDTKETGKPPAQEKKEDPISSGPITPDKPKRQRAAPPPKDNGFPGDRPMKDDAPPPPDEGFDEAEWLQSITNAYSGCEDTTALMEAQGKYMTPYKGQVSDTTWSAAVGITKKALKAIESRVQD